MEVKRHKVAEPVKNRRIHASRIFDPFRTLGVVTNNIPCTVSTLGQAFTVTTVVGRCFQIWDAANLHLLFVSQPPTPQDIDCIGSHFHYTFVCYGRTISAYKRARPVAEADLPESGGPGRKIIAFGDSICVVTPHALHVYKWSAKTSSLSFYTSVTLPKVLGNLVDAAHLPTYLNKLVVATASCLVLVNIKTGRIIHTFDDVPSGVLGIEPCPVALDIAAVVTGDGGVRLVNIRSGDMVFHLAVGEPITSCSFRSDGTPLLGVGTANGDVFFYDLDRRRRIHSLRGLHGTKPVTKLQFLTGQPLALSCGADNRVAELVFDPPLSGAVGAGKARILRQRGGHAQPPSCLEFADPVGDGDPSFILSGSLDQSLWSFSLRKDAQSQRFSTGSGSSAKEVPPIVDMAYQREKQDRWPTLCTVHRGESWARVWHAQRGKLDADMILDTPGGAIAKCVTVSQCGNFGIVGSAAGGVAAYNLQSGNLRKLWPKIHDLAVSTVVIDPTNTTLVTTGLDGRVVWTDFRSEKKVSELDLESAITQGRYHAASGLLAVSLDSMALFIIDTVAHRVVRRLWGHGNRITSFDWSADGRLLVSAALDGTVRTWDIPTGGCVDAVPLAVPATCLRLSPHGDWMVTAHVSGVGIQLWSLRTQFKPAPTRHVTEDELFQVTALALPSVAGEGTSLLLADAESDSEVGTDEEIDLQEDSWQTPAQLDPELQTFSGQPLVKFTTLLHLDNIRKRSKPTEPVKKPAAAPFFLGIPTPEEPQPQNADSQNSAISNPSQAQSESEFTRMLRIGDLGGLIDHLTTLGASATDIEIRSLDTREPYNEVVAFIDALTLALKKHQKFELVQAWAHMLFRAHPEILGGPELQPSLERWRNQQNTEIMRMRELHRFCGGVLSYLRTL